MSQIPGKFVNYIYISAEYNYDDLSNPIHYRVAFENHILIDEFRFTLNFHHLHANLAYRNDNTTTTFYNVDNQRVWSYYPTEIFWSTIAFTMDDKYDIYVPYIDYQPIVDSNKRSLDSNNDENIMSMHYFIFYIIAQTGGFLAFFMLFIGAKIKSMNETYLMYKTINDYNFVLQNIKKNDAINESHSEQAAN